MRWFSLNLALVCLAIPFANVPATAQRAGLGSGGMDLPPRVVAEYIHEASGGGSGPTLALLILWRGQPGWYARAARASGYAASRMSIGPPRAWPVARRERPS